MIRTLVFVGGDERLPWLRVAADGGITHGSAIAELTPLDPALAAETIAVVPGDAVAMHWTQLPELAPAQLLAAARMLAADVSAAPVQSTHVAIGPQGADGWRALALVDSAAMMAWLAQLAASGIDPDRMLPSPLLLAVPEAGVAVLNSGGVWQVRGHRLAFAAETELARLMTGDEIITQVDAAGWQAGLVAQAAAVQIDLRQGGFARARRWHIDRQRLRRLALAALALLAMLLATEVAMILRFGFAADRAELQLADAARSVLPRGTIITEPRAQVAARAAQLGGDGFASLAAVLVAAVRDRPALMLYSVEYAAGTGLVASMSAPGPADRDALLAAFAGAGVEARLGEPREAGGVPMVELRLSRR